MFIHPPLLEVLLAKVELTIVTLGQSIKIKVPASSLKIEESVKFFYWSK